LPSKKMVQSHSYELVINGNSWIGKEKKFIKRF
jgi:hypothetical protein